MLLYVFAQCPDDVLYACTEGEGARTPVVLITQCVFVLLAFGFPVFIL